MNLVSIFFALMSEQTSQNSNKSTTPRKRRGEKERKGEERRR
jgi:hypothetical protein